LYDRTRPAVRDDKWQRIWMFGTNVDEVNVHAINLGDELRQGVQFGFYLAPVVICRPIPRELLHRRELHTLRCVRDRFPSRPLGGVYAPAKIGEGRFWNVDMERADLAGEIRGGRRSRPIGGQHWNDRGREGERRNGCLGVETSPRCDAWGEFDLCFHIRVWLV